MTQVQANEEPQVNLIKARVELENRARSGASWFYWIAVFSVLNSILVITGEQILFFPAALAATNFLDLLAMVAMRTDSIVSGPVMVVATAFRLALATLFATIGYFARKRHRRAYSIGMVLYAVDALVTVPLQMWLALLFHFVALAGLFGGLKALRLLEQINASLTPDAELAAAASQLTREKRERVQAVIILGLLLVLSAVLWLLGVFSEGA